jgi:aspartyl-tRNA(Asn)/glutamyl-tRNA(Gln) amidotransferase subunit A
VAGAPRPGLSWAAFGHPFNLSGQPAVTVPCEPVGGLPVGLQIAGRPRADALVLRAAAAFEAARPWRERRPPL